MKIERRPVPRSYLDIASQFFIPEICYCSLKIQLGNVLIHSLTRDKHFLMGQVLDLEEAKDLKGEIKMMRVVTGHLY